MGRAGAGRRRAAPSGRSGNFTAGAGRKGTEAIPSAEYRAVFCHAASYGDDDPYDEKMGYGGQFYLMSFMMSITSAGMMLLMAGFSFWYQKRLLAGRYRRKELSIYNIWIRKEKSF